MKFRLIATMVPIFFLSTVIASACYEFKGSVPQCEAHFSDVLEDCKQTRTSMNLQGNYCEENNESSLAWCQQTCPAVLAEKEARRKVAETITFRCEDPFGVLVLARAANWLDKNSYAEKVVTASTRNVVISYPVSRALIDNTRTVQKITLDSAMAARLRNTIGRANDRNRVPSYVGKFPKLGGFLFGTGPAANFVIGELFSRMIQAQNAVAASGEAIRMLIADGGNLYSIESIDNRGDNLVLHTESVVYGVTVGKERRKVIMASCTYGAY